MANVTTLFLTWRGIEDANLWRTNSTDLSVPFPGQQIVPLNSGASNRPAIFTLGDRMLLAYRSASSPALLVNTYNYREIGAWEGPVHGVGNNATTDWGPSITSFGATAIMAFNGGNGDTRIWCSVYDADADEWQPQYVTKLVAQKNDPIQSGSGPAIVNWNGQLLMVWRGEGDNDSLYYSFSSDGVDWGPQAQIAGAASSIQPALTVFNGSPYLAWKGGQDDHNIYGISYTGGAWEKGIVPLGVFGTEYGPSITVWQGELFMTWKGNPNDNGLYWSRSATGYAGQWTGQAVIPGTVSSRGPAVTVYTGPLTTYV